MKSELKYFEICLRIFEESYIGVVLHAKHDIMERNMQKLAQSEVQKKKQIEE